MSPPRTDIPADIDPIVASVLGRAFKSITDEMSISLTKTTRSPILCEAKDFVTGLYDGAGRMLEQTENLPILSFSLGPVCKHIVETFGDDIHPGDVIFHNDVFSLGNQLNDVAVYKPIFVDGARVGWSACKGHQADIGGAVRGGYNPAATEVWQEALRIPAVKVYERGKLRKDVWDLIFANIRLDIVREDLTAQIGACTVGERRLIALVEKHGIDTFEAHKRFLYDSTQKLMESEIRTIPPGTYRGQSDHHYDAITPGSVFTIRVRIDVEDDHIRFDFSDSDPQTPGFVNGTFTSTASATTLTFLQMVNPDIPHNEGMIRPLEFIIPEGIVLNAAYPAATNFGNHLCPCVADAIQRALAEVIPARVGAGWNHLLCSLSTGQDIRPDKDRKYVDICFMGLKGGSGAVEGVDGYDHIGMIDASGGLLDQDYEMFEQQTPHRLLKHEYIEDSAGPGRWRGGLGVRTEIDFQGEDTLVVTFGDGDVEPAFGVQGGQDAGLNFIDLELPDGETRRLTTKDMVPGVPAGTRYIQEASGGGGYGDPKLRPAQRVLFDVQNGVVSRAVAKDAYGVVLTERSDGSLAVDEDATQAARSGVADA